MSPLRAVAFLALLVGANAAASKSGAGMTVNPIRKIVTMLQMMVKKVEAEGEKEQDLFDKFMCYCDNGATALQKSIDAGETKIPQVESALEKMGAEKAQLASDVTQHKKDREEAKKAMAEATALREKEAAAFAEQSSDYKTNIAAMGKAITAISGGAGAAFLQTTSASVLKNLALNGDLKDDAREALTSFLSNTDSDGEATSSEIVGILSQMKETMEGDLAAIEKTEAAAVEDYNGLMAAKTKEVETATAAIEDKIGRMGEAAVELVNIAEDLDDTKKQVAEDKKFLADMDVMCATRKKEFAEAVKLRQEELLALADTIKMLNDDDALELFKKTLPSSSSLLQIAVTQREMLQDAKRALKNARDPRLEFIALALHGKKVDMTKVIGMIDDMVKLLEEEQVSDNEKKDYCEKEFDTSEDEAKVLARANSKLEKAIAEGKDAIETLKAEIEALSEGIAKLDKQVARATENRQEENEDFKMNLAANTAAVELIGMAKNRMNKFYNPSLYKAPPKRELTEEERITLNMGGTLAPTEAPGGIAGTGIGASFLQTSAAPALAQYKKQSEMGQGVIQMMDNMVADVKKEMQEAEFEEKDAQKEYEEFMADSKEKRADDSKAIADKSGVLADTESDLTANKEAKTAKGMEIMANEQYIMKLHSECDWLMENFGARKAARSQEIDGLKKAKAVLSGADYFLVQKSSQRHLRKVSRA